MPPKAKEAVKKPATQVVRPSISDASLVLTPEDVIEGNQVRPLPMQVLVYFLVPLFAFILDSSGFQERIETGIDWTLIEQAARHHKHLCLREEIPTKTFSEGLQTKIENSIFGGFLNAESGISLDQQWELVLPITLWDIEKFENEEGKICFHSANCITDNMTKLIKRAVMLEDREVLRQDIKMVNVLRVHDSQVKSLQTKPTKLI